MALYYYLGNLISSGGCSNTGAIMPFAPTMGDTFLIKHRAGNSATEFANAVAQGYKATEGDVRFTSDKIPIMAHDSSIGGISISGHTLAELQAAGTVYTFDQWILDSKNANMFMDIDFTKTYTAEQCGILVDKILNWGIIGRCSIECGRTSSAPNLISHSDQLILNVLGANDSETIDLFSTIAQNCACLIATIPIEYITQALVNQCHRAGYLVKVWNSSDSVVSTTGYLTLGADQIIVDTTKPSDI